jgi:preprotein translocase subunit SecB
MLSPMRLDRLVVHTFNVRTSLASPRLPDASREPPVLKIRFEAFSSESRRDFLVPLSIDVNRRKADRDRLGYSVELRISGYFSVHGEERDDLVYGMVNLNAPAILYGIARGIVAQFTAFAPAGPVMLPSVNFAQIARRRRREGLARFEGMSHHHPTHKPVSSSSPVMAGMLAQHKPKIA